MADVSETTGDLKIPLKNDPKQQITLEFQPYIYMLDNDLPQEDGVDIRYKIMQYTSKNVENNDDSIYLYGMLPVEMIPAAYLPFRYDNPDINFNKLTYNDTLPDSYYENVFRSEDKTFKSKNDTYGINTSKAMQEFKKDLKNHFNYYLMHRLHNPRSTSNSFNSDRIILITCIFWMIILIFLMKVLYYNFYGIYTYLVFGLIVVLLIFAVLWKMFYTLQ